MSVSYDRGRFFSFVLMGGESHLLPVVARFMELGVSDDILALAEPISQDAACDVSCGTLGDVNVSSIIAIAESVPGLEFPEGDDEKSAAKSIKSKQILDDVVSLVSIANKRFRKSPSWPASAVEELLAKVS